jgi:hypothetical protein
MEEFFSARSVWRSGEAHDFARCNVDQMEPVMPARIIGQERTPAQALQRFEGTFSLGAGRGAID